MPSPVCGNCNNPMRPIVNGVFYVQFMNNKQPYKIWSGDLWKCSLCGNLLVWNFGTRPIAEHYQSNFKEILQRVISRKNHHLVYTDLGVHHETVNSILKSEDNNEK